MIKKKLASHRFPCKHSFFVCAVSFRHKRAVQYRAELAAAEGVLGKLRRKSRSIGLLLYLALLSLRRQQRYN